MDTTASRALIQTEHNYAQIEEESVAIYFGCDKFGQYICEEERLISRLTTTFGNHIQKTLGICSQKNPMPDVEISEV